MVFQENRSAEFADRLNKACDKQGIPVRGRAGYIQSRLPYNLSVVAIRKWLNGDSIPDTKKIADIAVIVGTTVEELLNVSAKSSSIPNLPNEVIQTSNLKRVPIISKVQAGAWAESLTYESLGDDVEWQETSAAVSTDAFALRVEGNSMTNPFGSPSIPHGSVVIVQPCPHPDSGKIVVAMLKGSDEATIKRLEKDGPNKYLIPLNPKFDPIPINGNCRIVGYVKQVIMDLD